MRCVTRDVIICCCLLTTLATAQEGMYFPKGFKTKKFYLMDGKKIIPTERQACRIHCTKEYFICFEAKRCHLKQNKHLIEDCKEEYNECMRRCLHMIDRIEKGDFPPPRYNIDTTD
ncbi:hypothetical protein LSAT2_006765 [Lamellibrachia satsuma]|nr:hypothetical protein LSAT2_006765 [Lamellibrachia satsuma]